MEIDIKNVIKGPSIVENATLLRFSFLTNKATLVTIRKYVLGKKVKKCMLNVKKIVG